MKDALSGFQALNLFRAVASACQGEAHRSRDVQRRLICNADGLPLARLAAGEDLPSGHLWRVFIEALEAETRVGIHPGEQLAPQPITLDATLTYRCTPSEADSHALIDYERYCNRVCAFLSGKSHTRLLETLAMEIAELSFNEWPALEALTLGLHKPKIRDGTRRIGVELHLTRAHHEAHCGTRRQDAVPDSIDDV